MKNTKNEIKNAIESVKINLNQAEEKMYKLEVKPLYIIQLEEEKHVRMKKS